MRHEKIFIREDKSKVLVRVSVWIDWGRKEPNYDYEVLFCEPRKRTWRTVYNFDSDYEWRRMNLTERKAFKEKEYLKVATKDEVEITLLELWDMLKPKSL